MQKPTKTQEYQTHLENECKLFETECEKLKAQIKDIEEERIAALLAKTELEAKLKKAKKVKTQLTLTRKALNKIEPKMRWKSFWLLVGTNEEEKCFRSEAAFKFFNEMSGKNPDWNLDVSEIYQEMDGNARKYATGKFSNDCKFYRISKEDLERYFKDRKEWSKGDTRPKPAKASESNDSDDEVVSSKRKSADNSDEESDENKPLKKVKKTVEKVKKTQNIVEIESDEDEPVSEMDKFKQEMKEEMKEEMKTMMATIIEKLNKK